MTIVSTSQGFVEWNHCSNEFRWLHDSNVHHYATHKGRVGVRRLFFGLCDEPHTALASHILQRRVQ